MSVTELSVVLSCFRVAHLDRKQFIPSAASAPGFPQCSARSSAALVPGFPQCPQHSAEPKYYSILPTTRAKMLESNFSRLSSSFPINKTAIWRKAYAINYSKSIRF
jgi:hypothetical protein